MSKTSVPKHFDTLSFNKLKMWGKYKYFCQQYKITSYVYKTSNKGTIKCPRYWVAYFVRPPYSWGDRVVNRDFDTPKAAMKACQMAWEHSGWSEVDVNAHGVKCYESLRDKHTKLNERPHKKPIL